MMSGANVSAGAASSQYYRTEGYYIEGSPEAETSTQWFGKVAEEAGYSGKVDDKIFADLLDGKTPEGGRQMGRIVDGERQHRLGLDVTFSTSKSVSLMALVGGDDRLIAAHDKAVLAGMEAIQSTFAATRRQVDGTMQEITNVRLVSGLFRHDTSRELDPQLHTHAVIANMIKVLGEERYTALHNDSIYANRNAITEIYRTTLEREVRALGYATHRGEHNEVVLTDVSVEATQGFSKRAKAMREAMKEKRDPLQPQDG